MSSSSSLVHAMMPGRVGRHAAIGGRALALLALAMVVAAIALPSTAVAVGFGSISGRVTYTDGSPATGCDVVLYKEQTSGWSWENYVSPDADGNYTFDYWGMGLPSANYKVEFIGFNPACVTQFYNNKPDVDAADMIYVDQTAITGIDAVLVKYGRVSGVVTDETSGTPIGGIRVWSVKYEEASGYGWWDWQQDTASEASGYYELTGLPTGTTRVEFEDPRGNYLYEVYNNKPNVESGTDIPVTMENHTTGIDAQLARAGHIRGHVDGNGSGLADIGVTVYRYDPEWDEWWTYADGSTYADSSNYHVVGDYDVGGLPTGTYRVEFYDQSSGYTPGSDYWASECWNDKADVYCGDDVYVTQGATTRDINATLSLAGSISGRVTMDGVNGIRGLNVYGYRRWSNGRWERTRFEGTTDASGYYHLYGLNAGDHRVAVDGSGYFATQYWNGKPSFGLADPIGVTAPGDTPGIDFVMTQGARIRGRVTGGTKPLSWICVTAYMADPSGGWEEVAHTYTADSSGYYESSGYWDASGYHEASPYWDGSTYHDASGYYVASGYYSLGGLPAGDYKLGFYDGSDYWEQEYWDDKLDVDSADTVTVGAGVTVSGKDAALVRKFHAPWAYDDFYHVSEDTPKVVVAPGVLANDWDYDGDSLIATLPSAPSHGNVELNEDGSFTYTPEPGYSGTDSFAYQAFDGSRYSDITSVTLSVGAVNDPPVAVDDTATCVQDCWTATNVLANDTDADGDPLTAATVTGPEHGTLLLVASGDATYTPDPGYSGTDTFVYSASDGSLGDTAAVVVTVIPGNPPTAANNAYSVAEDATLTVAASGVLTNDSDMDSDPLTAVKFDDPHHGTVTLDANGGLVYRPAPNYNGSDHFCYRAFDGAAYSDIATVTFTITPVNDVPIAVAHSYDATEDVQLVVGAPGLRDGCTAVDSTDPANPWSSAVAEPLHGAVTVSPDGHFTYMPTGNYNGSDRFTYRIHDGDQYSAAATVTITVAAVNDVPVASIDATTVAEDTTLTIVAPGFMRNDTDADGDTLVIASWDSAQHGTLMLWADGHGTYRPAPDFFGTDTFRYSCKDPDNAESQMVTVTVTVTSVNDLPTVQDLDYGTLEDTTLTVTTPGLRGYANDAETTQALLQMYVYSGPSHGTLSLDTSGSFRYKPAANWNGSDTFRYKTKDGNGAYSVPATVTLTVDPVDDAPVAVNDSYSTPLNTELTVTVPGVLTNDSDVDGDLSGITVGTMPAAGTLMWSPSGGFRYAPPAGWFGVVKFDYRAYDTDMTESNLATVTITVGARTVERITGGTRYDVAAALAKRAWYTANGNSWVGLQHVVVSCGAAGKEADPLAAAGLAGVYDAPVILVPADGSVPTNAYRAIRDIASANTSISVHIVGGTASVPSAAQRTIDRIAGVNNITRDAGVDRYAVTGNVAKRMASVVGTSGIEGVLIICSEKPGAFFDALAASPISFARHMPMIGVKTGEVPASVRSALDGPLAGKTRYVVSSGTYISNSVYSNWRILAAGRLATSSDRFTAATQIANQALSRDWLECADTGMAAKLPDALGGGAFMGHAGGVMLYTTSTYGMQSTTRNWITAHKTDILRGWIFGGTASVPSAQQTQFGRLLQ